MTKKEIIYCLSKDKDITKDFDLNKLNLEQLKVLYVLFVNEAEGIVGTIKYNEADFNMIKTADDAYYFVDLLYADDIRNYVNEGSCWSDSSFLSDIEGSIHEYKKITAELENLNIDETLGVE